MSRSPASGGGRSDLDSDRLETGAVSPPPVVIVDDPGIRAEVYREWLPGGLDVTVATGAPGADRAVDGDLGVAVLGPGLSTDCRDTVSTLAEDRSPICRLLSILGSEDVFPEIDPDCTLTDPVERVEFRAAVDRLHRRATYERLLTAYFQYTTRAASYEVGQSESDRREDDQYRTLRKRIERLRSALDAYRAYMTEDDVRAVLAAASEIAAPPFDDDSQTTDATRRPDGCTSCGLDWGVDHGPDLGDGFEQLGAFVWKCANCGAVQEVPSSSHRRLARR